MSKIKLCIIGEARSGKDTMAEILKEEFGYTFESSSMAAARIFIFDMLKDKYGYKTFESCYEDRVNKRKEWYELIVNYNTPDKSRLAKEIMKNSDVYVGMRHSEEIETCRKEGVFDLVIYVDSEGRTEPESTDSCTITKVDADIIIENKDDYDSFREKVIRLGKSLRL